MFCKDQKVGHSDLVMVCETCTMPWYTTTPCLVILYQIA